MNAADPLFDRGGWSDPASAEFRSLRRTTGFRLELLQRWLPGEWRGRVVLDLGCGGGLMAAPLAAAGARVLGIDIALAALRDGIASGGGHRAVLADLAELPIADGTADVVLLADVLEHVAAPAAVIAAAARALRPGGHLFVNTIHRTLRSRLLAITLAEGLGYVPRGTHRWSQFVTPRELDAMAAANRLFRVQRTGEVPRLVPTLRERAIVLKESASLAVAYAALYRRRP